jgi:hypothetical protein
MNEPTMNFGWDIQNDIDTAMHKIGRHTLGLIPHEHQSPNINIQWNEEKVYDHLSQSPNYWDHDKTYHNIIRKLDSNKVEGTIWDQNSIMHYPFEAGLILYPESARNGIRPAGGLSSIDREAAQRFYPATTTTTAITLEPNHTYPLAIGPGESKNYYIWPDVTWTYIIQTFGVSDTVMVLFQ